MKQACQVTGRTVLLCLVGFFGVVALANAIMIRAAISTFGGVETASSYQAGLAFTQNAAAARALDELHWQVRADVHPTAEQVTIEIDARDARDRPVTGLEASVALHHPTDRRADQIIAVSESALFTIFATCASPAASPTTMVRPASRESTGATSSRASFGPDRIAVSLPSRAQLGPPLTGMSRTATFVRASVPAISPIVACPIVEDSM